MFIFINVVCVVWEKFGEFGLDVCVFFGVKIVCVGELMVDWVCVFGISFELVFFGE